jgi:NAD(P)-dependent dehydrogenase (short-subunit alcohol dehydrogenase family)
VRRLAEEFRARHDRLDVLINNAAVIPRRREESEDGIEMQLAVNHLAPFLLTHLLLDVLIRGAPSRVIVVSSAMHKRGSIRLRDVQHTRDYSPLWTYAQSKLANVMFVRSLARRLQGTGVTVNAVHPGFISTNLYSFMRGATRAVVRLLAGSPVKGADTPIYLAYSPEVSGITGHYFVSGRISPVSREALDEGVSEALWRLSEELTGISGDDPMAQEAMGVNAAT